MAMTTVVQKLLQSRPWKEVLPKRREAMACCCCEGFHNALALKQRDAVLYSERGLARGEKSHNPDDYQCSENVNKNLDCTTAHPERKGSHPNEVLAA